MILENKFFFLLIYEEQIAAEEKLFIFIIIGIVWPFYYLKKEIQCE